MQRINLLCSLRAAAILCWFLLPAAALAGGPRWVTGPPYFTTTGYPVVWYTNQPQYYTDPGDLSSYVSHAAADALVAAAANIWNVPTSSLTLSYGGSLDEHVSSANVTIDAGGIVFPSDLQASNYQAKQIAVVYDSDGSVTDLLLGSGASDPSSCRQNAVVENVDSIVPAGYIQHAVLVLNGRCTGPAPEQLQMQYQLMRAFGRILGLGWSQTNDNVFTGTPAPTYFQALNWPIMHPIDIICGPYTYQCLPQPFTLRPDDLSALAMLYSIPRNQAPAGKIDTQYRANEIRGTLQFPNGQGMQGVNVTGQRWRQAWDFPEAWQSVSSVTGFLYKGMNGNPVTGPTPNTVQASASIAPAYEGYYDLHRIPMLDGTWQNVLLNTEPVNPLYTGVYAVGPYSINQVAVSGADVPYRSEVNGSYYNVVNDLRTSGAADGSGSSVDGTEAAPAPVVSTGWWTGTLGSYGHAAWSALSVKSNRSFTIEVTAQDEKGFATMSKAMPVIGVWNATDAQGTLPSVAAAPAAFNGITIGMTTLTVQRANASALRFVIADQRGDGRPDYAYQARVLYADSIVPANVPATGGNVVIYGMGFRAGDVVIVNGVEATVLSADENSISVTLPSSRALGFTSAGTASVAVADLATGGTTVMIGALSYAAPQPSIHLVTSPAGTIFVGDMAATPFAVRVLAADGVTPMANQSVSFTADQAVKFSACGSANCTVRTDALGVASTSVAALNPGTVDLSAASAYGTASASFSALLRVRSITPAIPVLHIAAGVKVLWTPQVALADNSGSVTGVQVEWQSASEPISFAPAESLADAQGMAQTQASVGPIAAGALATGSACAWTAICTAFTAEGVGLDDLHLAVVSGAGQSVSFADSLLPVVLLVTDDAGHPVAGATVEVHQTIGAWQMPCPDRGRCPIPPNDGPHVSTTVSDINGLVTISPRQLADAAEVTNIVAVAGTQGFVSLSLMKQP